MDDKKYLKELIEGTSGIQTMRVLKKNYILANKKIAKMQAVIASLPNGDPKAEKLKKKIVKIKASRKYRWGSRQNIGGDVIR